MVTMWNQIHGMPGGGAARIVGIDYRMQRESLVPISHHSMGVGHPAKGMVQELLHTNDK